VWAQNFAKKVECVLRENIFFVYCPDEIAHKAWEVSSVFQTLPQFPLNIAHPVGKNISDVSNADTAHDLT
jgi:hypothetical protein